MSYQSDTNSTADAVAPSGIQRKLLNGYVGFANLPNQVHRKSVRKGFNFTAMVVGMSLTLFTTCLSNSDQASLAWGSPRS